MNEVVLVIDAERMHGELARTVLERRGFRVLISQNGEEALLMARRNLPTLVILDDDGVEPRAEDLLPRLRNEFGADLPVVLRSASDPWRLRHRAASCHANDWVHKLDSIRVLADCVTRLARKAQ